MSSRNLPRILLVLALPLALLVSAFTWLAPSAAANVNIYTDALGSGWQDWSWGGVNRNFATTSPRHGTTGNAVAITYTGSWSGLQLGYYAGLNGTLYNTLSFWIHGGATGGQQITVQVAGQGSNGKGVLVKPSANSWTQVQIPLSTYGSLSTITSISWYNNTAGAQPVYYLDDIALTSGAAPTATATRTSPTATSNAPTATRVSPTATRTSPTPTSNAPTATRVSPTATRISPTATRISPTATSNSPTATRVSPTATRTSGAPTATPVGSGPALSVNAAAGQHAISPDIYGLNFADPALAVAIDLPVDRWGGNATTRYNWQLNISNHASDWYFENIDNGTAGGQTLPNGSASDQFVDQDRSTGTNTLLTVPLIGYTPKGPRGANPRNCGFPTSLYPSQQSIAPDAPCGNGLKPDGSAITGNNPLNSSIAINPAFVAGWINHLTGRYGAASAGGVRFYDLDNETALWNSTHRDVHPQPVSYDELISRTLAYAPAIKAADPGAQLLGPVSWGWTEYFYSALDTAPGGSWWNNPQDRLAHGNVPFVEWYLQQLRAYDQAHSLRLLDYLDLHYYPQASGVALSGAGSTATQQLRLRSTRSLWDPSYTDESWIGDAVQLIPRMKAWVAADYPGTKLAITEYNWGALDTINGAVTQADVLGIFGREGLDLATLWAPPTPTQPGAYAFRMYRNYDGQHHRFGETGVQAASTDQSQLAVYAARRADGALTIMVINKSLTQTITSSLALSGYTPAAQAAVFRYSAADLNHIVAQPSQAVTGSGFTASYAPQSITLFVLQP